MHPSRFSIGWDGTTVPKQAILAPNKTAGHVRGSDTVGVRQSANNCYIRKSLLVGHWINQGREVVFPHPTPRGRSTQVLKPIPPWRDCGWSLWAPRGKLTFRRRQFGECGDAGERLTPNFGPKIAASSSGDDTNPPDEPYNMAPAVDTKIIILYVESAGLPAPPTSQTLHPFLPLFPYFFPVSYYTAGLRNFR